MASPLIITTFKLVCFDYNNDCFKHNKWNEWYQIIFSAFFAYYRGCDLKKSWPFNCDTIEMIFKRKEN